MNYYFYGTPEQAYLAYKNKEKAHCMSAPYEVVDF